MWPFNKFMICIDGVQEPTFLTLTNHLLSKDPVSGTDVQHMSCLSRHFHSFVACGTTIWLASVVLITANMNPAWLFLSVTGVFFMLSRMSFYVLPFELLLDCCWKTLPCLGLLQPIWPGYISDHTQQIHILWDQGKQQWSGRPHFGLSAGTFLCEMLTVTLNKCSCLGASWLFAAVCC